eukprot:902205-Pyramimonas_sp.AAC.1
MAGRSQADDPKTAKKRNICALADKVGVHGYWNALEYRYERYKKEGRPNPRLDLNVSPTNGLRPQYVTAAKSIGKALAYVIKPEAATAFARLDFPQACAALGSLIRAAGIPSRISGEAIYLYAAYGIPYSTWFRSIPTQTWAGKAGAGLNEGDRMFSDVEYFVSSDSTMAFLNAQGSPALNAALKQRLE